MLQGDQNIFAWVRWSPTGDQIAFLKSPLYTSLDEGEAWIMNSNGAVSKKISDVIWNYPAIWSSDGTELMFANAGNIFEYETIQQILKNVTNFSGNIPVQHPSYSSDGKIIIFSSGNSGSQQIWSVEDGSVNQVTYNNQQNDYPILP